ncbi:MAG: bifunctional pyr operon transcriptional regulator/uracil phosphoribosyltransferase PyrR [Lentisphaeria bacterium]|nr:bifunctional pyr operon transcriptional regulator/uracil phosphoribosyltransferase PyrR [Lentisphaeria bacterium]MBQ7396310.1 bifunctional pyr operon transcriptional regulator/uracil phosphoribosyltransferase PyrR [Lentisphaeria bacterium]MBR7119322.1 bifunctional pyr operon transcriptional regulator/uracil phosphoribosyltransferase PyrR [Lentisphaeria bacterium]
MSSKKQLIPAEKMWPEIKRMAMAIHNRYINLEEDYAFVGIQQLGVPLAEKLQEIIINETGYTPALAKLDISMYRDDISNRKRLPLIRETDIPFDVNDKILVLVDDVLSSGRTIRAALDAITDYGRPKVIRLAVLVDRGNPEFPIHADFTGFDIDIPAENKIVVEFEDEPGIYCKEWN